MSTNSSVVNPVLAFKELKTTVAIVSNISRNLTKAHLSEIFSAYGPLKGVYIPKEEDSKLMKNYAYLEFLNKEDAEKAVLYMGDGQIDGLVVEVEILSPPEDVLPEKKESNGKEISGKSETKRKDKSRSRSRSYTGRSYRRKPDKYSSRRRDNKDSRSKERKRKSYRKESSRSSSPSKSR